MNLIWGIPVLIVFAIVAVNVAGFVFWIWMLIDCASHEPSHGNDKLVWIVIMIFTNWIGALLYLFVRRPRRIADHGR